MLIDIKKIALAPVLDDLGISADRVSTPGEATPPVKAGTRHAAAAVPEQFTDPVVAAVEIQRFAEASSTKDGLVLVYLAGREKSADLAAWRNALWPFAHVVMLYRLRNQGVTQHTLSTSRAVHRGSGLQGSLFVARRRSAAFDPDATVAKFDQNAAQWNGEPLGPGYAHYRWMRRLVAHFTPRPDVARILDFGCGAGWVGIEAALRAPRAELCAFDPSPEMTKLTRENAQRAGLARVDVRTGFGEAPPYPAPGEAPFDLVLSSGVLSFAGDAERWFDGLVSTVAPGGTLIIGDINRDSLGMRKRRAEKVLLPLREMNAHSQGSVREALERRGFVHEAGAFYQVTWPVPQAMHVSERRLGGILNPPLLWLNRAATRIDGALGANHAGWFDSWILRLRRS